MRGGEVYYDHCTFLNFTDASTPYGMIHNYGGYASVLNTICANSPTSGLRRVAVSNYNCLYSDVNYLDTTPGVNDITNVNPLTGVPGNGTPALLSPVKIEEGSDLINVASDGGNIGATILKQIGRSGTIYGEAGFDQL